MAYKYGRRPPKRAPALKLSDYLTGAVPAHPAYVDYLATLPGWQMLGNDRYGDCVAVTWANTRRLVTSALATANYPSLAQVESVYETQNPGFPSQDNGMDIQTLLEYLTANAGPDGAKAVGFAQVDHTNPDEVKAAIAIFGSVWTGIIVTAANENQFSAGQSWDYIPNSQQMGGHSVIVGGYGTVPAEGGPLTGDQKFITWAQETSFTDSFWANQVEECWAVIWPEHLGSREFTAGMNLQQFAADYTAITGNPFPAPVPAPPNPAPPGPNPPPQPPVPPKPVPSGWGKIIQYIEEVIHWVESKI